MSTEPKYPIGYCEGFGISLNVTHPDHQIDIAAGACRCCEDCDDMASDATITVDIEDAGVNGLDAGAEAASTLYYVWLIHDIDTCTVAGLLSISDSAPTMPAGYTYKRLLGNVMNDAGEDFETPTDEHFDIPNKLKAAEAEIAKIDLSGGQLKFPATQSASADVNTLDDYEEGTWTPTLWDAVAGGNEVTSYFEQDGVYTKVGDVVHIRGFVYVDDETNLTAGNAIHIRGLPFASEAIAGNRRNPFVVRTQIVTFAGYVTVEVLNSSSVIFCTGNRSGLAPVTIKASDIARFTYFSFSGTYKTT